MFSNGDRESAKGGSSSNRDSIPDWVPYAESSIANKSSRDLNHSHNVEDLLGDGSSIREPARVAAQPAIATVPEQVSKPRREKFRRTVQGLWKIPAFLKRSSDKKRKSKRASWRSDDMITEEFSISVVQPEEIARPMD
jgi:hypothetical protein